MSDAPATLAGVAFHVLEVKKSRFEVIAGPVTTPNEAMAFFATHAITNATHNCWAYRIGQEYRFNDDGEPSGTAGKPILQAIDGQSLDGVAVLVVRWYGGIKLGAGGLARAYGGAAAECLRLAPRHIQIRYRDANGLIPFDCQFAVYGALNQFAGEKIEEVADEQGLRWWVRIPLAQWPRFAQHVRDATRGRVEWFDSSDD